MTRSTEYRDGDAHGQPVKAQAATPEKRLLRTNCTCRAPDDTHPRPSSSARTNLLPPSAHTSHRPDAKTVYGAAAEFVALGHDHISDDAANRSFRLEIQELELFFLGQR